MLLVNRRIDDSIAALAELRPDSELSLEQIFALHAHVTSTIGLLLGSRLDFEHEHGGVVNSPRAR